MIRFLQTPSPTKKIVLGSLLLLICGAMVVTLIPGGIGSTVGLGGPGQGVVAKVDGEDVTTVEVQRQAKQMIQQQFPRGGAQSAMLMPYFAQRAAEIMISDKALLAEARRLGLRATDDEVRDELQHGRYASIFFPGGNFIGQQAYEERLQSADLTVPVFEKGMKDGILFDKMRTLITGTATVMDADVRREFDRSNTKIKFDYVVLRKDDVLKEIHPNDAELSAFYERNKATYANSIPEKRKINYVLLDSSKIEDQIHLSQDDLQGYYNQHRDEYRVPEQVNVRHILIKTPVPGADGKADPKGMEEARTKAADVLKQLHAGADFSELAKKYSEDPGSAKNGGVLGAIGRGRTVPEFEKAAFSLPKGGTSELVQSSYGFHIIHVDDRQEAHLKTLDEVKPQIEPLLKRQKAAQQAAAQANALVGTAHSDGLEKAAAAKGLQVTSTDFVVHSDSLPGVANSQQLLEAVFNERDKNHADQAQLAQGYAVFEVIDIKPAATPTFEEIRTRLETEFKNERAGALLSQKIAELSDHAKADHDLKKAAKDAGQTIKSSDLVAPDGQVPDIGSMSGPAAVAFTMKPGEISGPIKTESTGVVLSIVDRQAPSEQDYEAKKDGIRAQLQQGQQTQVFDIFLDNLRARMEKAGKIKINQDEMKALTKGAGGGGLQGE